jgi:serine/threonine protein kinase
MAGFKLDRYELLCPIAEGGMARVWISRQTGKHGFEKLVAIKTILPKLASDTSFQTMFVDEARIAARIEHANVAHVLDVGEQHGTTYLVMEYVDGEALSVLHRTLKKKNDRVPTGILLRILADVCGGLHAAHDLRGDDGQLLNVVHRDVSPQNILLGMKGVAKLIDFGIAKARDRIAGDTNTGTVKGKVRYMAPEQAVGATVDRRADIWSVGAILYHLISGKPPYDGENDVQTLLALTSGRLPAPLAPTVHPAIVAIVKRTLVAAPEQRFASAAELQQAIEDAIFETKLQTSTAAVATFLQEHVGPRAVKRREAISLGIKAAADREKYAALMRSNVHVASSPDTDAARRIVSLVPPDIHSSVSKQISGTLGSAAIDLSRRQGHSRTVAMTGALMGVTVVVAGLIWIGVHAASSPPVSGSANVPPAKATPNAGISAALHQAAETAALPAVAAPTSEAAIRDSPTETVVPPNPPTSSPPPVTMPAPIHPISRVQAPAPTPAKSPVRAGKPKVDDGF